MVRSEVKPRRSKPFRLSIREYTSVVLSVIPVYVHYYDPGL